MVPLFSEASLSDRLSLFAEFAMDDERVWAGVAELDNVWLPGVGGKFGVPKDGVVGSEEIVDKAEKGPVDVVDSGAIGSNEACSPTGTSPRPNGFAC